MRRLSLVLVALLAVFAVSAVAIDIKGGRPAVRVLSSETEKIVSGLVSQPWQLPNAYTIYSSSAANAFYLKRSYDASVDSVWIKVPAGKSLLVPAPAAADSVDPSGKGTTYYHKFFFSGHSDTLYVLPWVE